MIVDDDVFFPTQSEVEELEFHLSDTDRIVEPVDWLNMSDEEFARRTPNLPIEVPHALIVQQILEEQESFVRYLAGQEAFIVDQVPSIRRRRTKALLRLARTVLPVVKEGSDAQSIA